MTLLKRCGHVRTKAEAGWNCQPMLEPAELPTKPNRKSMSDRPAEWNLFKLTVWANPRCHGAIRPTI